MSTKIRRSAASAKGSHQTQNSPALLSLAHHSAVLLTALPTGTGPFMLAEFYNREAWIAGRVEPALMVASISPISGYLALAS